MSPSTNPPLVRMQVQLEDAQIAWLGEVAKQYHSSKTAVLRAILKIAMRDYELALKEKGPTDQDQNSERS